ncbi:MAG: hypothetical protein U0556_15860 [Dehalococcoidia bacterium]
MIVDDRVWTVRFRRELADQLRARAATDGKTVQQVIVAAVEALFAASADADDPSTPSHEQDTYQYGGGPAS